MNTSIKYIYLPSIFFNFLFSIPDPVDNTVYFNQTTTIDGNVIVKDSITCNGNLTVEGQESIFNGTCNITNNTESHAIIFGDNSSINFQNLNISTNNNVLYLCIDKSINRLYTSDSIPIQGTITIENLVIDTISNKADQNIFIGNTSKKITIGNNNNTTIFNKTLLLPQDITINNPNFSIIGSIDFQESLLGENINIDGANMILKSNNNAELINITSETCNILDPINLNGDVVIGKNDFSTQINILDQISCKNISFGNEDNIILKINGLELIDIPTYHIIINDKNFISKIKSTDHIKQDVIIDSNISADTIFNYTGNIIFNSNDFTVNSKELNLNTTQNAPEINILKLPNSVIIKNFWGYNTLFVSKTLYINNIKEFKTGAIGNANQQDPGWGSITFDFKEYFFNNMMVLSGPNNYIGIDTNNKLINILLNQNLIPIVFVIDNQKIQPVKFVYKDSYKMQHNDICPKNKTKIIHFGFTAENLEQLNIKNLIEYDNANKPYNYDETVLLEIFKNTLLVYENKIKILDTILNEFIIHNNYIEKEINKKIATIEKKTILYKKIKNLMKKYNIKKEE